MTAPDEERAYRQALGGFATGVVLVVADTPGGVAGIVVNSFTSVSLVPRLVLWCLGDGSDRYGPFAAAETWSLNVLAADQEPIARRVAQPGAWRIDDLPLARVDGARVLEGAVSHIVCRTFERRMTGDHLVIVGEALAHASAPAAALTYFRGRFGRMEN